MRGVRGGIVKPKAWGEQRRTSRLFAVVCLSALLLATCAGLLRGHAQDSFPLPAIDPPSAKAAKQPKPDSNQPTAKAVEDPRKQEIASECANLLKMATELKLEVDKSTKDTLSLSVVRKAGEIEQLAHKVRATNGKS